MKGYPRWFSANFIALTVFIVFLTGLILIPSFLEMRMQQEVSFSINGSLRLLSAAVHVFVGFLLFAVLGALCALHVRQEWRKNKNKRSGISMIAFILLLGSTGVGIYYLSNNTLIIVNSLAHIFVGSLLFLFFIYHMYLGAKKI